MAATYKLTQRFAEGAAAGEGGRPRLYFDGDLKGFALLVGKGGTKSWVAQREVKGRTRRVTLGRTNTLPHGDARAQAASLLLQMANGVDPKAAPVLPKAALTVREGLEQYLRQKGDRLRSVTADGYRYFIERYLTDWLDRPLGELSRTECLQRHADLSATSGNGTANGVFRTLRCLYQWASDLDENLPPRNPAKFPAGQYHTLAPRKDYIEPGQLGRWWAAADELNESSRGALRFGLLTGLRKRPLLAMRWEHVDWEQCTIHIPAENAKNGQAVTLPLGTLATATLTRMYRQLGEPAEGWCWPCPTSSGSGHLVEPRVALVRIAEATGVTVTVHGLRRTYATACMLAGVPEWVTQRLMTHTPANITAAYVQLGTLELTEYAERVDYWFCEKVLGK